MLALTVTRSGVCTIEPSWMTRPAPSSAAMPSACTWVTDPSVPPGSRSRRLRTVVKSQVRELSDPCRAWSSRSAKPSPTVGSPPLTRNGITSTSAIARSRGLTVARSTLGSAPPAPSQPNTRSNTMLPPGAKVSHKPRRATTPTPPVMTHRCLGVKTVPVDGVRGTAWVLRSPLGVSSYHQARSIATGNPRSDAQTSHVITGGGIPIGSAIASST